MLLDNRFVFEGGLQGAVEDILYTKLLRDGMNDLTLIEIPCIVVLNDYIELRFIF